MILRYILPSFLLCAVGFDVVVPVRLVIFSPIKQFFQNGSPATTVNKLPPVLEFILQRIQSANSNFVHEDLSRPPTWEKPVYTLSPAEEEFFYGTSPSTPLPHAAAVVEEEVTTSRYDRFEYDDLDNTTEIFFEKITGNPKPTLTNNNPIVVYKSEMTQETMVLDQKVGKEE
ncbi:hypothetical protein WA026_008070 [Henosepilachna vigintioctopunctata]|uniref:Uncharacterized protein n=1 Tax=Henosepilachna vigintioctopunctata TaxID=420089 RepID=A0AAW1TQ41_9CUCU